LQLARVAQGVCALGALVPFSIYSLKINVP
jgi:hypothetical protein